MKVDDFIRYINNTLYVRHICHGWNCKRCIFLQLNIKRCLWDVKIPTSLGNMSAALVNETPQLYVQATSCLPLHVLKLLNVKPDFVMLELQLISDVSRAHRRLQYLWSDSLPTLSTTMWRWTSVFHRCSDCSWHSSSLHCFLWLANWSVWRFRTYDVA